jgi:hypothetical protein
MHSARPVSWLKIPRAGRYNAETLMRYIWTLKRKYKIEFRPSAESSFIKPPVL